MSQQTEENADTLLPLKCYCTMLDRRARFMRNGFTESPCDGTLCAAKRAAVEAAAARTTTCPTSPADDNSPSYLVRDRRWPPSLTALVG